MMPSSRVRRFFEEAGLVGATTVGAGMFALPYVVRAAGWIPALLYFAVLSAVLIAAHAVYFETLRAVRERARLLGLARAKLSPLFSLLAWLAVVGGQALTLVAYLLLGSKFFMLLLPAVPWWAVLIGFWALASLPLFLNAGRLALAESFGAAAMAAIVLILFFRADWGAAASAAPSFGAAELALPFGPILFALAGWTAIEPLYDAEREASALVPRRAHRALAAGTAGSAILYGLFTIGVLGLAPHIAPDTFSGLGGAAPWFTVALGALGLLAIWTSYAPSARELEYALADWKMDRRIAAFLAIAAPLLLVGAGVRGFLSVVGFAGGVCVSAQYLAILLVGGKVLQPRGAKKLLFFLLGALFLLAALYEVYYFVV